MERIGVGLIGMGTVGGGVVRLLTEAKDRIARRAGRELEIRRISVRDVAKPRDAGMQWSENWLTSNVDEVLDDPSIGIVVEVAGGIEPARSWILKALSQGKHVVTANKALLAEHGQEIFAAARENGRAVAFEASVGGGIPIIQAMSVALTANQIRSLAAILNGTCNFILSSMSEESMPYESALRIAQELGYAEADPTMDVDGSDTAHKLAILSQVAFESNVKIQEIPRQGIDKLALADIKYAGELGYAIKLLALAQWADGELGLRVAPTLVKRGTPLAEVRGPYNAIRVVGDAVGDVFFYGRGAGSLPTASAVVGDLIDVATGRALMTSSLPNHWGSPVVAAGSGLRGLAPSERIRSRYYLRFTIADKPGVLASLAKILGEYEISIASVIQHDPGEDFVAMADSKVPLVVMTHIAPEAAIVAALNEIDQLDAVRAPSVRLGVLDS